MVALFCCAWAIVLLVAHFAVGALCAGLADQSVSFCPPNWPLSEFAARIPQFSQVLVAAVLSGIFYLAVQHYRIASRYFPLVVLMGIAMVLGSNLLQGWSVGFRIPVARGGAQGEQYFQDAVNISAPLEFVRDFNRLQPTLGMHSRTHPPGAVLSIYFLYRLLGDPALISVGIALIATSSSMLFIYGILRNELKDQRLARYISLLFIVMPAVQIYFAASIDALVACGALGALYFVARRDWRLAIPGMTLMLFATSTLTFGVALILPGLLAYELASRRQITRFTFSAGLVAVIYLVADRLVGFNYLVSYSTAVSAVGSRAPSLAAPYILTRIEDIAELIVFSGPFLLLLFIRALGRSRTWREPLVLASYVSIAVLLGAFLTGLFDTGETARIALFIFPSFLMPIAYVLRDDPLMPHRENALLYLVMGQTVLMQLLGLYYW